MKLKSFNYILSLLIFFLYSPLYSEEKIDIWKNNKENTLATPKLENENNRESINTKPSIVINLSISSATTQGIYKCSKTADENIKSNFSDFEK